MRRCALSLEPQTIDALTKLIGALGGFVGAVAAAIVTVRSAGGRKPRKDDSGKG